MSSKKAKNPVRSLERGAQILELLKELDGARLVELESRVDLSKGTIHSYLATLEQCGLVSREGRTYTVGLGCLTLGGYARDREPLYVLGREGADELAESTGELVALMIEWNGRSTYLYQRSGERAMTMDSHLGVQLPMHCTASGKAILAELSVERVEEILDVHGLPVWTDNTITDREELHEELEGIRSQGVAFDDEERIDGLRGIGVPIKREGSLLGSIAMAGPVNRLEGDWYREELPDRLIKIKRMIEVKGKYPQR